LNTLSFLGSSARAATRDEEISLWCFRSFFPGQKKGEIDSVKKGISCGEEDNFFSLIKRIRAGKGATRGA
jgi:hypothetical protein